MFSAKVYRQYCPPGVRVSRLIGYNKLVVADYQNPIPMSFQFLHLLTARRAEKAFIQDLQLFFSALPVASALSRNAS